MSRIAVFAALVAVLAAALLPQVIVYDEVADDAYISFRYADRFADGDGLTFNPGERVEGFSNPLWTLATGVGLRLTPFDAPDLARVLGLLCALATLALIWAVTQRLGATTSERIAMGLTACGLVLAVPGFHVYATSGLEVPLLMVLLTAGVSLSLTGGRTAVRGSAFCFGLAGITRPEGALYGLLWFVSNWLGPRTSSGRKRVDGADFALLVLPSVAYQVFRVSYYGDLLPNTFLAKPPGIYGSALSGLREIEPWVASLGGPVTLVLIAIVLVLGRSGVPRRSALVLRQTVGPILAGAVFVLYARGDWMPFGRFLLPVWPLIVLSFTALLFDAVECVGRGVRVSRRSAAALLVGFVAMVYAADSWAPEFRRYLRSAGPTTTVMHGHDQVAQGEWIARHIAPGSTVAVRHIGAIAYLGSDLVIWDVNGLTDREQAEFVASGYAGGLAANPVLNRFPDVIAESALPTPWSYINDPERLQWMQRHYTKVESLDHGPHGTVDVWVLAERLETVLDPPATPADSRSGAAARR